MPTNNFVECSFWNFDALFQPQQHPARDAHDTFFLHRTYILNVTDLFRFNQQRHFLHKCMYSFCVCYILGSCKHYATVQLSKYLLKASSVMEHFSEDLYAV